MSKIKNGELDQMAKCKALTGSAMKGLRNKDPDSNKMRSKNLVQSSKKDVCTDVHKVPKKLLQCWETAFLICDMLAIVQNVYVLLNCSDY